MSEIKFINSNQLSLAEREVVVELDRIIDFKRFKFFKSYHSDLKRSNVIGIESVSSEKKIYLKFSEIEYDDETSEYVVDYTRQPWSHDLFNPGNINESMPERADFEAKGKTDLHNKIKAIYSHWVELLDSYENEPLPQSYLSQTERDQGSFYSELRFNEKSANYESFSWKQQILLDEYLEKSINILSIHEEQTGADLSEVKDVAEDLRQNQTNISKNEVVKRLSKFWALCKKNSVKLFKTVVVEAAKAFLVEIGKQHFLGG